MVGNIEELDCYETYKPLDSERRLYAHLKYF